MDQRQHDEGQHFTDLLLAAFSRAEGRQLCYSSIPQKRKFPLFEEIFPLCPSLFGTGSLNKNLLRRETAT